MAVPQIKTPFSINAAGYISTTRDPAEQLRQAVVSALTTRVGERMMRGNYGSILADHAFDNLNPAYGSTPDVIIQDEATEALARYAPDILVNLVTVESVAGSQGEYRVTIHFSQDTDNVDLITSVALSRDLLTGS